MGAHGYLWHEATADEFPVNRAHNRVFRLKRFRLECGTFYFISNSRRERSGYHPGKHTDDDLRLRLFGNSQAFLLVHHEIKKTAVSQFIFVLP